MPPIIISISPPYDADYCAAAADFSFFLATALYFRVYAATMRMMLRRYAAF